MPVRYTVRVDPLDTFLGYWLRFVSAHFGHQLSRELGEFGVSVSEWIVLRELQRTGPRSPRLLALDLGLTESAMSRLVVRLERNMFVERSRNSGGRRRWQLSVTSVGRSVLPTLEHLAREHDTAFFGHMSGAEREQLRMVLKRTVRRYSLKPMPLDQRRTRWVAVPSAPFAAPCPCCCAAGKA
jgi:DNA-binding MarR family transcriptional regulator